ncbi:hypothetical protein J2Z34_001772 [Youngiibacter multivorans]|uniref:Uncharacterized protein n=1 Tax=Youngiibacter multivorans TaxID=937251 RepID=A0ABS4G417_9CLOT|nr:hypothetical protein [Youngiibacter multivorans]
MFDIYIILYIFLHLHQNHEKKGYGIFKRCTGGLFGGIKIPSHRGAYMTIKKNDILKSKYSDYLNRDASNHRRA